MDREQILREIASQIASETARGITLWTDPDWNDGARRLLATHPTPARAPLPPTPARTSGTMSAGTSRPSDSSVEHPKPAAPARPVFGPPPPAVGRSSDWAEQLAAVGREALACTRCRLHERRTKVVFDSGTGKIALVFVGEGPGADEDAQGEAFVGRAGQLLTRIIAAMGLDRRDVYICNVVKCRPPENRNPFPDEMETCAPFLERQIAILKPAVICTLGLIATQHLLGSKAPIGKLRGRIFRYRGTPLLPTYHPAALLRNPNLKRIVWEDIQLLRKILDQGVETPGIAVSDVPDQAPKPSQPVTGDLFG